MTTTTGRLLPASIVFLFLLAMGASRSAATAPSSANTPAPASGSAAVGSASAQVGQKAPDFSLQDTDGKVHRLGDYLAQGHTVVLEWFNPDCPFVKRHHEKLKTMDHVFDSVQGQGVFWLAINSGAPGNQGAGLERNREARKAYGMAYPVLLDESGDVGRLYGAKTTPGMYVVRSDGTLLYAGAIDNDPRGQSKDTVNYVSQALAANAAGKPIEPSRTDSYGCSVKYGVVQR